MAARSGASTLASTVRKFIRLHQRVAQRDHPRLLPVAAERVAEADLAARQPHRRARNRGLAEIERRTVAANTAAQHDQAVLRLAQILMRGNRDGAEPVGNISRIGMRQHRHRRLAQGLPAVLAARGHVSLLELSFLPESSCLRY
jgi:hypothetical protein